MRIEPTEQQKDALIKSTHWWKTQFKQVWEISGAAGTGKTTIVYMLIEELGLDPKDVLFMAYVGKATLALARKGNFAQTIHSTIYYIHDEPMYDDTGAPIISNGRIVTKPKFVKRDELPRNIKLLVVDEGAMVSEHIAHDILSFGLPVVVLGDINQLPPVFGNSYFLQKPDVILTEPMRQALNSPIVKLAQMAMNGKYIKFGKYGDNCFVIKKDAITETMLTKSDIVICGKNSTRTHMNKHIRENILNIHKRYPTIGEKLICRQNNWKLPPIDNNIYLINGLIGYVDDVSLESFDGRSIAIDFRPEFLLNEKFNNITLDYKYLLNPSDHTYRFLNKFEYAYAITCHLAQGSEYDKVFIYDEHLGTNDYYKRWLYTAITRAKKGLILAI